MVRWRCPVINTTIPFSDVAWVSPDEESGLTIPVGDATALAAASQRLISEPGLRDRLCAGACARAVAEFDYRLMASRSLQVYKSLVKIRPLQVEVNLSEWVRKMNQISPAELRASAERYAVAARRHS